MHRCIATSIAPRTKSREWCTSQDLFFLYCLLYRRPCALARSLAQFFASAFHRQERGLIYGGTYITIIARSLGYNPEQDALLSDPIEPSRLDRKTLQGMRMVRKFPGVGLRFRTRTHQIFVSVPLPDVISPPQPIQPAEPKPDAPPHPQGPPPPPEPPQYPQHIIRDGGGMSPADRALLQSLSRRADRMEDLMMWMVQEMSASRRAAGFEPHPLPPPRQYQDPGVADQD